MICIRYSIILIVLSLISCHSELRKPAVIIDLIERELELSIQTKDPRRRCERLQEYLQELTLQDYYPELPVIPTLCTAISRYQFYYFLSPNIPVWQQLRQYYQYFSAWEQQWHRQSTERIPGITADFYQLRKILQTIYVRNQSAPENAEKLLQVWQRHPQRQRKFLQKLLVPWEVGGVVLSDVDGIAWQFVTDPKRLTMIGYIQEFKNNDFEHLDILERAFMKRIALIRVRTNSVTREYVQVLLKTAHNCFVKIRRLIQHPPPFSQEIVDAVEKQKSKLLRLGLERKLVKRSFSMDKKPYLVNSKTAFFFHSHPYVQIPHYQNGPSGHDEEMTFRTGPSLVFEVAKKWINLYMTVLGKSSKIAYFPIPYVQK